MSSPELEAPETYIDLLTGELLIGQQAVEAQFEIGNSYIAPVKDLLAGQGDLPTFSVNNKNKYVDWTNDDFINNGRWLMRLINSDALPARTISRASALGIMPSIRAINSPLRFSSLANYQEAIDQLKIDRRHQFDDWSYIDHVLNIRGVGTEEGRRPTERIIMRRVAGGAQEPGPRVITKKFPLSEVVEGAGYLVPESWGPRQYLEWGYLFFLANSRGPVQKDHKALSPKDLGPGSKGVNNHFGSPDQFRKQIADLAQNRLVIKAKETSEQIRSGDLPQTIVNGTKNPREIVRTAGRYKILRLLELSNSDDFLVRIAKLDNTGKDFVRVLNGYDPRIEDWLVEAAAWKTLSYPELFPDGELIKAIRENSISIRL